MNLNKYTEKAQEAVVTAHQLADREGHPEITPEHVLLTLFEQRDGIVPSIARKLNADPAALAGALRTELGRAPRAHGGAQAGLSPRLRAIADFAEQEAERLKDEYVSTEHLLIAIASEGGRSASSRLLQQHGMTRDAIMQALTAVRGSQRWAGSVHALGVARPGPRHPRRGITPRRPGFSRPCQSLLRR